MNSAANIIALMLLVQTALLSADELPSPYPPPVPPATPELPGLNLPDSPPSSRDQLRQSLEALKTQRRQLEQEMRDIRDSVPFIPDASPRRPTVLDRIHGDLERMDDEQRQKLQRMRSSIESLERLFRQQTADSPLPDALTNPGPDEATPESTVPDDDPGAGQDRTDAVIAPQIPEAMTQSPVDRIALGDNLFASREIRLALGVYEAIDLSTLDERDRVWVAYQTACCHRRLGDRARAATMYRDLVSNESYPQIAQAARWWLNAIERRKQLNGRLDRINAGLTATEDADDRTSR